MKVRQKDSALFNLRVRLNLTSRAHLNTISHGTQIFMSSIRLLPFSDLVLVVARRYCEYMDPIVLGRTKNSSRCGQ